MTLQKLGRERATEDMIVHPVQSASNYRWAFVPFGLFVVGWLAAQYQFWGTTSDAWDHYKAHRELMTFANSIHGFWLAIAEGSR